MSRFMAGVGGEYSAATKPKGQVGADDTIPNKRYFSLSTPNRGRGVLLTSQEINQQRQLLLPLAQFRFLRYNGPGGSSGISSGSTSH